MSDDPVTVAEELLAALPVESDDHWSLRDAAAPHVDRARRLWAQVTAEPVDPDVVARVAPAVALAADHLVFSQALAEGLALARSVCETCDRVLGPEHGATARSLHAYGIALSWTGDKPGAATAFERAAATRSRTLGHLHPDAIDSRLNLASALSRTAPRHALRLAQTGAAEAEEVLGPDDPTTLSAFSLVAGLAEDPGTAKAILVGLLASWQEAVGPEHHATLLARLELAPYSALPRTVYKDVLADAKRVLGPRHPLTLRARMHAAETASGPAVAERRVLDVLDEYRGVFGPRHNRTLYALDRYAMALRANGRHDPALKVWQAILTSRQEDCGPTHPAVLLDAQAVGLTSWSHGRIGDAAAAFGLLVEITERAYGSDHPLTVAARCRHVDIASDAGPGAPPPHPPDDDELRRAAVALTDSHGENAEATLRVLATAARRQVTTDPARALESLRDIASRAARIWSLDLEARLLLDVADAAAAAGRRREAFMQYLRARDDLRSRLADRHPLLRRSTAGVRANLLWRRSRTGS